MSRPKPYQGVRVREPVKELLRRKRSLAPLSTMKTPPTVDAVAPNSESSYTPAEVLAAVSDGGLQCAGWRAASPVTSAGLLTAATAWSSSDYSQQERPAQAPASSTSPALFTDVYMQTLCPSYTMLTYTHTPLLTNFGTRPAPASLHQMELPDSELTYLPWAQPFTTISTLPNPGVTGPVALAESALVHMPLSMSLNTMIPQLECQGMDPQPQILDLPELSGGQLDSYARGQSLNEDLGVERQSQSLLDRLLENQKANEVAKDKDSYCSSLFILKKT